MANWTPSALDLEFTNTLVENLKDGGMWAVPCNNSLWTFHKQDLRAVFRGDPQDVTNARIRTILEDYIGYTVVHAV